MGGCVQKPPRKKGDINIFVWDIQLYGDKSSGIDKRWRCEHYRIYKQSNVADVLLSLVERFLKFSYKIIFSPDLEWDFIFVFALRIRYNLTQERKRNVFNCPKEHSQSLVYHL